jgi:hypothetical protein
MQHTAAPENSGFLVPVAVAKGQIGMGMRHKGMLDLAHTGEFHLHGQTILLLAFVSAQHEHCSAHRQLVQTKELISQSGISPMKKKQAGSTVTQSTWLL